MITTITYKLIQQRTITYWETIISSDRLSLIELWYNRNVSKYPKENFKIMKLIITSEEEVIRDSRV